MERRSFLRLLSATAATVALPVPLFVLAEPGIVMPDMPIELGAVRALAKFEDPHWWITLDVCNRYEVTGICFLVSPTRRSYLERRAKAEIDLREMLKQDGWIASDIVALPPPPGYTEPDWMRA